MRHASEVLHTGIGRMHVDDPLLTDRSGLPRRRRLLRVILDSTLALSPRSRLVQTADNDLVVFTAAPDRSRRKRILEKAAAEIFPGRPRDGPTTVANVLY